MLWTQEFIQDTGQVTCSIELKYLKNQVRHEKAVTTFLSYFKSFLKLPNNVFVGITL